MKNWILYIFNLFLVLLAFVCCFDTKKYVDSEEAKTRNEIRQVYSVINDTREYIVEQNKQIEQNKQY